MYKPPPVSKTLLDIDYFNVPGKRFKGIISFWELPKRLEILILNAEGFPQEFETHVDVFLEGYLNHLTDKAGFNAFRNEFSAICKLYSLVTKDDYIEQKQLRRRLTTSSNRLKKITLEVKNTLRN